MRASHDRTRGRDGAYDSKSAGKLRNARKSTGPRTAEGKARSSRNAISHGIYCRDVVLPGEDAHHFFMTRQSFLRALKPQDAVQLALVDAMTQARWPGDDEPSPAPGTEPDSVSPGRRASTCEPSEHEEHATSSRPGLTESGSREATTSHMQNEPTAASSHASAGPADGCDDVDAGDAEPDPAERAQFRRLSERMTRARPPEHFLSR